MRAILEGGKGVYVPQMLYCAGESSMLYPSIVVIAALACSHRTAPRVLAWLHRCGVSRTRNVQRAKCGKIAGGSLKVLNAACQACVFRAFLCRTRTKGGHCSQHLPCIHRPTPTPCCWITACLWSITRLSSTRLKASEKHPQHSIDHFGECAPAMVEITPRFSLVFLCFSPCPG